MWGYIRLFTPLEGVHIKVGLASIATHSERLQDMDFVQPSSDYSRQGIGILFVPALDFHRDSWLHARIAVLRVVEENVAVAVSSE